MAGYSDRALNLIAENATEMILAELDGDQEKAEAARRRAQMVARSTSKTVARSTSKTKE